MNPKTTDTRKPLNHLHDMMVNEVSFVEAGANGRDKWLIAKRAEQVLTQPPAAPAAAPAAPVSEPPVAAAVPAAASAPAPVSAPAEVDKSTRAVKDQLRRFHEAWNLIHGVLDRILADNVPSASPAPAASAELVAGDMTAKQASAPPVEVKLPEQVVKALEQIPVLVARVQEQDATIAKLAGERNGSNAIAVEQQTTGSGFQWHSGDLNELRQQRRAGERDRS